MAIVVGVLCWSWSGLTLFQQGALFYAALTCNQVYLDSSPLLFLLISESRILMISPFVHHLLRALAQSPSPRSIILAVAALSDAALHDAPFSISDLHTIPAYVALLLHAFTVNALNRVTQRLTLNFLSPNILRLSSSSLRLYSPFLSMPLAELYPSFHPTPT